MATIKTRDLDKHLKKILPEGSKEKARIYAKGVLEGESRNQELNEDQIVRACRMMRDDVSDPVDSFNAKKICDGLMEMLE